MGRNKSAAGGATQCPLVLLQRGYPVGRRMEGGRDCVERNRSERAKIANVAEWKPPASFVPPHGDHRSPRSRRVLPYMSRKMCAMRGSIVPMVSHLKNVAVQ